MKTIKRMLALALAVGMCLSLLGGSVWAAESDAGDTSVHSGEEIPTEEETSAGEEAESSTETAGPAEDKSAEAEPQNTAPGTDAEAEPEEPTAETSDSSAPSAIVVQEDEVNWDYLSSLLVKPKEYGEIHSLVIQGSMFSADGFSAMRNVLSDLTLPYFKNTNTPVTLQYAEGGGVTWNELFGSFQEAFGESGDNDLNILYYGGHTGLFDGKSPSRAGLVYRIDSLSPGAYWEGAAVSDIFAGLNQYNGHFVLLLDTCHAEAYYKYGLLSLNSSDQGRYEIFGAVDENHSTDAAFGKSIGIYTKHLLDGIGYNSNEKKRYNKINMDKNGNGNVTIDELSEYMITEYNNDKTAWWKWCPFSFTNYGKTPLFHFAKTEIEDKDDIRVAERFTGETEELDAKVLYDGGKNHTIHWRSSSPSVATVNETGASGIVSFISEGVVTITCYLEDDYEQQYQGSETEITFEVTKPSITVSPTSLELYESESKSITATVEGTTKKPKWKSSKKSIATVDQNGKITGKKAGTCTITAYFGNIEAVCTVTVKKPTIKLNKTSLSLEVKKTATLKATVDGPSKKVTWKSSNTKIATVDKNGKVTAKKEGKCTITATANGVSAKCEVKVQSEKDKAIEAYKKFLSQNTINWCNDSYYANSSSNYDFCLTYLDNNDVPELMLWERENSLGYAPSRVSAKVALYTYYNGKVKYVDAGNYSAKNYKKKGVYIDSYTGNGGYWAEFYYLFSSGKAAQWLEYEHTMDWSTQREYNNYYKYDSKKKTKIKKSEFKKILKKKVGSAKRSSFTFHKNTKANREKYLK